MMRISGIINGLSGRKIFILFFLIWNALFLLSNIPNLRMMAQTPAEKHFFLHHIRYLHDFPGYAAAINQGSNGELFFTNPFTGEKTEPVFFYTFYTLSGLMFSPLRLPPYVVYHLVRILTVEILFLFIFLFLNEVSGRKRRFLFLSLFLYVFSTSAPMSFFNEENAFFGYIPWWSHHDMIGRLDSVPHHMGGPLFFVACLYFGLRFLKNRRPLFLIFSSLSSLLASVIYPTSVLPLVFSLPVVLLWSALYWYRKKQPGHVRVFIIGLSVFVSVALGLFANFLASRSYLGKIWTAWENGLWNSSLSSMSGTLSLITGILLPLAVIGTVYAMTRRKWAYLLIFMWAVTPFLSLLFSQRFGLAYIRLVNITLTLPFAVISALPLSRIRNRALLSCYLISYLTFSLISSYPIFFRFLNASKYDTLSNFYFNSYQKEAIDFISDNLRRNDVVFSNDTLGLALPSASLARTGFAHVNLTFNYLEKRNYMSDFFSGKFSDEKARQILSASNVSYVYYGEDEKASKTDTLKYGFLEKVFSNPEVEIFKVNY